MQFDLRRDNLRRLINQHNGPSALAAKLGYANASFLVQMTGPHPSKEVTEKTARKIEAALGLEQGWLDRAPMSSKPVAPPVSVNILTEVVRMVTSAARDLGLTPGPDQMADLVGLVYEDAQEHGLRREFVERLVHLLK